MHDEKRSKLVSDASSEPKKSRCKFTEKGHFEEITVFDREAKILKRAQAWENIPQFVVITGANGTGKSQLLNYLFRLAEGGRPYSKETDEKVIYIDALKQFEYTYYGASEYRGTSLPSQGEQNRIATSLYNAIHGSDAKLNDEEKGLLEKIQKCDDHAHMQREDIVRFVANDINYRANELPVKEPLAYLQYVFDCYEQKKRLLRKEAEKRNSLYNIKEHYFNLSESEVAKLHASIEKEKQESRLSIDEFVKFFAGNENFAKELIDHYVCAEIGDSPLDAMNVILEKYGFKYHVSFDCEEKSSKNELKFYEKNGQQKWGLRDLSTGEKMAISMMAWRFYLSGFGGITPKMQMILLDEPDRHLDPILCKQFHEILYNEICQEGIQVIMSTHRLDTLMLIPDNSVFVIKHQGSEGPSIQNVPKSEALFRMTKNIRQLTDYHYRVYVEAPGDALFYETVYGSLNKMCDSIREKITRDNLDKKASRAFPIFVKTAKASRNKALDRQSDLLSQRHQMSFYSTTLTTYNTSATNISDGKEQKGGGAGPTHEKLY